VPMREEVNLAQHVEPEFPGMVARLQRIKAEGPRESLCRELPYRGRESCQTGRTAPTFVGTGGRETSGAARVP
jgi:hypothetical protein